MAREYYELPGMRLLTDRVHSHSAKIACRFL